MKILEDSGLIKVVEEHRSFSSQDVDIKRDQVFFSSACLAVTNEEYMQLLNELKTVLIRYLDFTKTPERGLRIKLLRYC